MPSAATGRIRIGFQCKTLDKVEEGGWIFASNGKAFVAVKFLDGAYEWDEAHELASNVEYDKAQSTSRFLLHAGDATRYDSFEVFRMAVLANPLTIERDKVEYQSRRVPIFSRRTKPAISAVGWSRLAVPSPRYGALP